MKDFFQYIFCWVLVLTAFPSIAQVEKGFLDLRQHDFSTPVQLSGTWEFYWEELIYPGKFENQDPVYFEYPSLWNDQQADGEQLHPIGFATYRAVVVLPEQQNYQIHLEDAYSSFELYFNGELIAKNGKVGSSKSTYTPYWKPMFVPLIHVRDTNELVLQVANFDHSKGGATQPMEIGEMEVMSDRKLALDAYDFVLTGSLLMGGLFFLGLYFFGRHDTAILYFSLFCMVYSYRIIGGSYYLLHSLVNIPWHITARLEYISMFLSAFLLGKFVENLYPEETFRKVWKIGLGILAALAALALFAPAFIYTQSLEFFLILVIIYLVLTIVVYVRAYWRKRPGAEFALISIGVIFLVIIYTILGYLGVIPRWPSAYFCGHILFFFSQSLILSYRFAYFLKNAKEEAELAAQAKTDFLSTISHEIRTPLNAVVGISHFLLEDNPRKDQEENMTSLKYSAEHLTTLINDILDYNKLESGTVDFEEIETNLSETANSIFKGHKAKAEAKGLKMILEIDDTINSVILTDKTRLSQILNNLLDNAIKFTRNGTVTLRIKKIRETSDQIAIHYEVADTGIGIPRDKQQMIFERFTQASSTTTREFGGTGLGLSIIKRLLELQGSSISVKSEEGSGSVFSFEQTYKKAEPRLVSPVTYDAKYLESKLREKRVLLVEDNQMNVMVTEKFLKRWHMVLEVASDGEEAVKKATENYYDIILMDLQMPVMDGYQAAIEIRGTKNPVPIVALTASALISIQERVLSAGMNDYITKPFDPEELKRKLAKNIRN